MSEEPSWISLKDVCSCYGMNYESAKNAVRCGTFPVPTYKLGRLTVVDKAVHTEFFARKRRDGLLALKNNKTLCDQPDGDDL